MAQLKEMKRLADLKEQEKKSEEELKKMLNPATFKAQALKWEEHEEKKAKMLNEFNKCISKRTNPLPITKISYVFNSSKTVTMRITRDKDPLNLTVYPDFRLRMLCFSEWLETKTLGLPPPPELATFGMTAKDTKRKKSEMIKHVFVKKDVVVDETQRNVALPLGVVGKKEFHITSTVQLIRLQKHIVQDSPEAKEMYKLMELEIESRLSVEEPLSAGLRGEEDQLSAKHQLAVKGLFECKASKSNIRRIQVKDIVKEVENYLKTYSSAGMDIS
ncbi:hypothetical protein Tco_0261288 [Tanacetum coccineum]